MCVKNVIKTFITLTFPVFLIVFFVGCEAMDEILSSAGSYKINVQINGVPLDECSYARYSDKLSPYFEESVSNDPDVTALVVFLRDSRGEIVGLKVNYNLDPNAGQSKQTDEDADEGENESEKSQIPVKYKNGDEMTIPVSSLDDDLPSFPIPVDLPMDRYTMVSQVMSGKDILQRTEKSFFYLGRTIFSFDDISVYLPGITDSSQLIPRGTVVMLEADLDFNNQLDPYIIWYDGKRKIKEGSFSEGAGYLFWKAPEQSGFFSLRAEIFPVENFDELAGYQKEISLLVSSKAADMHLVPRNIPQLIHWYVLEGNLNDSKRINSASLALKPAAGDKLKWMGINGTYGLATGCNNAVKMPKVSISNNGMETWQILFRFNVLNNGDIFSVLFNHSGEVSIKLSVEGKNLILTLTSPLKTVSQNISLPLVSDELLEAVPAGQDNSFITAGLYFSIVQGLLTAQINVMGDNINNESAAKPLTLDEKVQNEFQIMLGFLQESSSDPETLTEEINESASAEFTALWDEFALYYMLPLEQLTEIIKPSLNEEQPLTAAEN